MSERSSISGTLPACAASRNGAASFRIEELLRLDNGDTLYKVKSDTEPFDRVVAECDLALMP